MEILIKVLQFFMSLSLLVGIHEFGHYMNEIYNEDKYSQSFDLLETHSQGQEMLFMSYAKPYIDK